MRRRCRQGGRGISCATVPGYGIVARGAVYSVVIRRNHFVRRRLFTLFSAVSLLACVAVCVLWVRSYTFYDAVEFRSGGPYQRWWRHASNQGILLFQSRFLPAEAYRTDRVHA